MQTEEIDNQQGEYTSSAYKEKTAQQIFAEEEEALKMEQEEMGPLAKQMWILMQKQKPSIFNTMRKFKTLASYLSRFEDVMILNVTKLCQTGISFELAKSICLKEMKEELGLVE